MYAVIEDSGSQIKVSPGDVIRVDVRELADDVATITFDKVMAVGSDEGSARIGQPYVDGVSVTGDIMREGRTDKVPVVKFKRRKNYIRKNSHRQDFLQVKITGIEG